MRCEKRGKSQSSYIKFYASGMSARRRSPCERTPSSSGGDGGGGGRRFCAPAPQADCFLSRRFNGAAPHRTRRKKIRKTTDVFCALPRYFTGDSRIASPPRRRSSRRFAAALFNSGVRLPRSHAGPPPSVDLRRSPSRRDNFFDRSSSRNSAARIFRPSSSYIPAR